MRRSCRVIPLLLLTVLAACADHAPPPVHPPAPAAARTVATPPPLPTAPATPAAAVTPTPPRHRGSVVGLLLPQSGPAAALGAALLNAAQLALFDVAAADLTLLPFDSKGTAEGAAAAIGEAVAQHVEIIVGPLLAAEVRAAAPLAAAAHVPMLTLSADRSVAGRGTYVLGFAPGPQAIAVADYAASQGRLRQAVLAPSNDYGRTVVTDLVNAASKLGIAATTVAYYDPAALDLATPLKHLLANRKGDDPGFDALLLPDEGERLRRVGEQWAAQGWDIAKVALLGTMVWDEQRLGDQPALAGAWYAAASGAGFADFARRYGKAFGAPPPRLASLAYDAVALVAALDRRAAHDFSPGILTNPEGFTGLDGLLRLRLDGTVDRAYAIKEVVPGGLPREILPAATSFSGS